MRASTPSMGAGTSRFVRFHLKTRVRLGDLHTLAL
jgi:hypothetical protein